jgi:hypothetical protein
LLRITNIDDKNVTAKTFGGKAVGLSLLSSKEFQVPKTVFIEACVNSDEIDTSEFQDALKTYLHFFSEDDQYDIAIRSSSTTEDAFSDSMAGHFKTILGRINYGEVVKGIKEVIESLSIAKTDIAQMGVILQEKINAEYSGVIFSSDPLTYSKRSMVVSYIAGMGDRLVSGIASGKDVAVSISDGTFSFDSVCDIDLTLIETLCRRIKQLEQQLNYPIDVEWAIKDGEIFYLQCRPLASITMIPTTLQRVIKDNLIQLPKQLIDHDKVELRLKAQETRTLISDAYVYVRNTCQEYNEEPLKLERSEYCKGYSAVIIYPRKLSNKIIRSFVGEKTRVFGSVKDCCRYGIRSFPEYDNILGCLNSYAKLVSEEYWVSTTIIQEIFDPLYTGIIQQIKDGYLIEITRGHFLTKGVVPTSQYAVDEAGKVITRREIEQRTWFKIIEGHVIYCVCNESEDTLVSLSNDNLRYLIEYFSAVFNASSSVVEFGVLKESREKFQPYLIDFVDDSSSVNIASSDISTGIISRGKIQGAIMHIPESETDSLDIHFHDENKTNYQSDEAIVFFCRKPDIALLPLLEKYNPNNIGFVFEDGSVLCHLAVVLRERGIPAVKIGHFHEYEYPSGRICLLDAETIKTTGKERVINE